jgi:hypothetical protein
MSKRKEWLEREIGLFVRQYARKHYPGHDSNDRRYDREIEQIIRRMSPADLDELMHGGAPEARSCRRRFLRVEWQL